MNYPAAPWTLKGHAYATLHLIDVARASKFIPTNLEIVQTLPGKTIGGVFLGKYEAGSTLTYGELIVVAGLVRHRETVGAWISHIYVDNPSSIAGGREIWHLPKEDAQFFWRSSDQGGAIVRQGERVLCDFSHGWQFNLWRQSIQAPVYSQSDAQLLRFEGRAIGNAALISSRLSVPESSPFARLIDSQQWLALKADSLEMLINPPIPVAASAPIFSTVR